MFRLWAKTIKDNRIIKDMIVENDDQTLNRTKKIYQAVDDVCYDFDLAKPLWLESTIEDFKKHDKTRFTQDNFIESIDFDYLEIDVIEEDNWFWWIISLFGNLEVYKLTTRFRVLEILEKHKGDHISGSRIADHLDISRNSVWKAIKHLQEEGHNITAITNKGYCLNIDNELLSSQSISKHLKTDIFDIKVYKEVESTNSMLKLEADSGASEGHVIIAEQQTKGRGRRGRSFFSPESTGVYMSLLLRPKISAYESLSITTCAAVAVAQAIEMNSNKEAKIKWVNDIFLDDKKVSGILTEASMDLEGGGLKYAILGIGINVFAPTNGFPKELENISTSVFDNHENSGERRSKLIADILEIFMSYYKTLEEKTFLSEYRNRSMILNKEINVIKGENNIERAFALDIDENFRLKVQNEQGEIEYLNSGEVSIRKDW